MKSSFVIYLICTFVYAMPAYSQNPVKGMVINNRGDTLHGRIVTKGINQYYAIILKTNDKAAQIFFPDSIKAYVDNDGNIFVRSRISYDVGPFFGRTGSISETYGNVVNPDDAQPTQFIDTSIYRTQNIFVKLLVFGEASLFYLQDSTKRTHFFISNKNGPLTELTFRRFLRKMTANSVDTLNYSISEVEDNAFRGQLIRSFSDCSDMKLSDFEKIQYYEEDIVPLFRKYDLCKGKLLYIEKN
jgi:hypothetical protein